jgi:hypothetical protein
MPMFFVEAGADRPDASMLFRMFSTDVAEREEHPSQVLSKQPANGVPVQESNMPAGKSIRFVQFAQAWKKVVPFETLSRGKLVRLEQLRQV